MANNNENNKATKELKKPFVNHKRKIIEVTAKYYKASGRYGTVEYRELEEILSTHPDYTVKIKTTKKQSPANKGLTYQNMEKYIKSIGDEAGMEEYKSQHKLTEGCPTVVRYQYIKMWFEKKYPQYVLFQLKNKNQSETPSVETALPAPAPANT